MIYCATGRHRWHHRTKAWFVNSVTDWYSWSRFIFCLFSKICMSSKHYYRNHKSVTENICLGNGSKNPNIMTYTEPQIHSITWNLCRSVHLSFSFWSSQAVIWYYKPCQANSWVDYSIITFSASAISDYNLVGMSCPDEKTKSLGPTNSHLRYSCLQRTCNFRLKSWYVLIKYSFDN